MLNAEPNEAIALMFGYLNMFMAACGLDISKIDSRYSELNAEAVFSNHKMTAEQKKICRRILNQRLTNTGVRAHSSDGCATDISPVFIYK